MIHDRMVALGSQTAKNGFRNEDDIVDKFNSWSIDNDAQLWLKIMGYKLEDIEYVYATKIKRQKTDVQVQVTVTIKLKSIIDAQNIQVKLVSNTRGFNQIDKRWVDNYVSLWNMPSNVAAILKRYTGEVPPIIENPRDNRRTFADEFEEAEISLLLNFLEDNKALIVNDILKGRGQLAAEWMLVAQKILKDARWILKPINYVINYYGNGEIHVTNRGNIKIGNITMQRKGGDGGRSTANMLQFKINPAELFDR